MTIVEKPTYLLKIKNNTGRVLKMQGVSYDNGAFIPIPCITRERYTVQRAKLWGKDTGRETMNGNYTGSIIGIFIKITAEVASSNKLTSEEWSSLQFLGEQEYMIVRYYDTKYRAYAEGEFYSDDITDTIIRATKKGVKHSPLTLTFVATRKFTTGWLK